MNPSTSTARSLSRSAFLVVVLLVLAAGTGLVLAIVHLTQPSRPGSLGSRLSPGPELLTQRDTIKPHGHAFGIVVYPITYAAPPALTLSGGGRYLTGRQDENGFTWVDRRRYESLPLMFTDFPGLRNVVEDDKQPMGGKGEQPEFTWEAKGVTAGTDGKSVPGSDAKAAPPK
jgi:hypothetical protein